MKKKLLSKVLLLLVIFLFSFITKIDGVKAADGCYVDDNSIEKTENTVKYSVKCKENNYINIVEIKDSGWAFNNRVNYKKKEKKASFSETYKTEGQGRLEATISIRIQYFNEKGENVKSTPKEIKFGLDRKPEYITGAISENETAICITNWDDGIYQNYMLNDKTGNAQTLGKAEINSEYYSHCFTGLTPETTYKLKFCRGNNNREQAWKCTEEIEVRTPKGSAKPNVSVKEDSSVDTTAPKNAGTNASASLAHFEPPSSTLDPSNSDVKCSDVSSLINKYWQYVMILVPIVLILLITIDFVKAVVASDAEQLKKSANAAVKRAVATVILLILPVLLSVVLNWFGLELCL